MKESFFYRGHFSLRECCNFLGQWHVFYIRKMTPLAGRNWPGHFFDVEKWLGLLFDGGHYSSLLAILRYYISLNMGKKSRRTKGRRQSGIIWIRTIRYYMYQVDFVRRYTLLIIEMTSIPFKEHTTTIHTDTWWTKPKLSNLD